MSNRMIRRPPAAIAGQALALLLACSAAAGELTVVERLVFDGDIPAADNIIALGIVGDYLVVGSDEAKHAVHVLKRHDKGYRAFGKVRLSDEDDELDIEAIAVDGKAVYAMGSHS